MRRLAGPHSRFLTMALTAAIAFPSPAFAQEPFYKNRQLRIIISTGVGGGYNEYARALEHHLPRHIAGAPAILVQSMPKPVVDAVQDMKAASN